MKNFHNIISIICILLFGGLAIYLMQYGAIGIIFAIVCIGWGIKFFLRNKEKANKYEQTEILRQIKENQNKNEDK